MLLIDKMITVYPLHKNGKLCMYVCVCLQSAQLFVMHMGPEASNAIKIIINVMQYHSDW